MLAPSGREVDRLQEVYRDYQQDVSSQSRWSDANPGNQAIGRERRRVIGDLLQQEGFLPLGDRRVLDVGCGSGKVLAGFRAWGAAPGNLYGIDLMEERIRTAQETYPDLHFQRANAEALPFSDGFFDLVLLYTVFTSILDPKMRHNVAREVRRVLKPGGAVVWYDFRYDNPRNPHVRKVEKREVQALFPGFALRLRSATVLPLLARRLGPATPLLYPVLARVAPLRTHYAGLLLKPAG